LANFWHRLKPDDAVESGIARGPRAVFGGPPKTSFHQLSAHCLVISKRERRLFGGPPNTAGQQPALPDSTAGFRLNGEWRLSQLFSATATQTDLETAAKNSEKVKPFIEGKTIKKIIVVPKKMVNLIVG
jgi:hypothetical protein